MSQAGLLLAISSPSGTELNINPHGANNAAISYMQYSPGSVDVSIVVNCPVSIQSHVCFDYLLQYLPNADRFFRVGLCFG